ncbi:hypothetical protein [Fusobacterium sp. PH5-44]|uniref:hypothetical protein n=1 Tax=unclassified Fusobacterium TaxID=2648384 RepID=UPI003D1EA49A
MQYNLFKKKFIFFLSIIIFILTGCGSKNPISIEDFTKKLTDKGYQISPITNIDNNSISNLIIAKKDDHQFEFCVAKDDDNAVYFFNKNKTAFEKYKGSVNTSSKKNIGNVSRYTLTSNGKYHIVSRIGNTVLYLESPDKNKSEIEKILKEIGY